MEQKSKPEMVELDGILTCILKMSHSDHTQKVNSTTSRLKLNVEKRLKRLLSTCIWRQKQ